MDIGALLLLALVLVCSLMMLWMMRRHRRRTEDTQLDEDATETGRSMPAGKRAEELERHEPPYTKSGGIVAPKFGSAGSGGAEYERGPETHDR